MFFRNIYVLCLGKIEDNIADYAAGVYYLSSYIIFSKPAEEGHHASVFFKMTNKALQPRKIKAVLLGFLAHIVGWKILLYFIAQGEYSAYKKYEGLIADFPEVNSVRDDENRHGDIMLDMRKRL